jgi:hypothetical protein
LLTRCTESVSKPWLGSHPFRRWVAVFFYLLAFLLFLRVEKSGSRRLAPHALAALAYLPALFFKEAAFSFPLLVIACWFFFSAAAEQFRAAREIDPTYRQAYTAEAQALEAAGDAAGAAAVRKLRPPAE